MRCDRSQYGYALQFELGGLKQVNAEANLS